VTALKKGILIAVAVIFLLMGIAAAVFAYAFVHQIWIFEVSAVVGFPVEITLHGAGEPVQAGWHMAVVPDEIAEKAAAQPDTLEYAANWYRFGEQDFDMDISDDVIEGEVPLLLQWDKRWGYELYGGNYMGINGCAPTALAIVYAGLTGKTDVAPYDIAEYSVDAGLYLSGMGTKWELMEVGGRYLGLRVQRIWKDQNAIRNALAEGKLLTVRVGKGDFTDGGHFLVVCGIEESDLLEIRDPNSPEKSAQLWEFDRIMEQATCWWSFGA